MSGQLYYYTARARDGRAVTGSLRVDARHDAVVRLRSRGLFVISLHGGATRASAMMLRSLRLGNRGLSVRVIGSLAVLLRSGVSLRRSLQCVIEQCADPVMRESLEAIAHELDGGTALSEAMRQRPREFSEQVVALVAAGELGGTLDQAMERAALLLERESALRRQVAATLIYPGFVLSAAAGLMVFLLVATVPAFSQILIELHARLPLSTRVLLGASALVRMPAAWAICAVTLVAASGGAATLLHDERARKRVDRVMLRVPFVGLLQRSVNVAAFARALGTLLQCGVVITDAVATAAGVAVSAVYREAAAEIRRSLAKGATLAPLLAQSGLFGAMAVEMAYVGEESGALDTMLLRIAEYHEAEVTHMLRLATGVLEPAVILLLGGVIGTIVASILVPLYGAIANVR